MTSEIQSKVEKALDVVREIHSDTSGDLENNIEALEGLGEEVRLLLELLQEDVNRRDNV